MSGTVAVRCAVCEGSGAELVLCPDGSIGVKECWWCQGTGEIERAADPGVCPCCRRPMVPAGCGEAVCPDHTAYAVSDDADLEEFDLG